MSEFPDKRYGDRSLFHHGLAWRMRGFPIFDDGEIVGIIDEPLWRESELSASQRAQLAAEVDEEFAKRPSDSTTTRESVLRGMLEWEGVEHDQHVRGRLLNDRRPAIGYECKVCRAAIVNTEPKDSPFVGGPLDGHWRVTDGRMAYDVPIPNRDYRPALVTADVKPTLDIVTYYRDERGTYRLSQ